jgi:nucleotide-binding universal stress UspA family protein
MNESTVAARAGHATRSIATPALFARVVCGVDGSEAGFLALEQAARLVAPDGRLIAATVCNEAVAVHAGMEAARLAALMRDEAEQARTTAEQMLRGRERSSAVVVRGRPADALRRLTERERADLLVVGSHGTSRPVGMLLGSVATAMLHEARCSVLVARLGVHPGAFPQRIVVGVDGSPASLEAYAMAEALAAHTGAALRTLVALGGERLDLAAVGDAERDPRHPVAALRAASFDADLLVVGSRGLTGIAALGSVSERIAHRARCSVLVVKPES